VSEKHEGRDEMDVSPLVSRDGQTLSSCVSSGHVQTVFSSFLYGKHKMDSSLVCDTNVPRIR
jgi:hypothetical protein